MAGRDPLETRSLEPWLPTVLGKRNVHSLPGGDSCAGQESGLGAAKQDVLRAVGKPVASLAESNGRVNPTKASIITGQRAHVWRSLGHKSW